MEEIKEKKLNCDAAILEFGEAMDELIGGKLILADKNIARVLQIIAGNKKLYSIIKSCTNGYDFSTALSEFDTDENGIKRLKSESAPLKQQIAFVFCLLYSFDIKKIKINDFLHEFFESQSAQEEYEKFSKIFLRTFKKLLIESFMGGGEAFNLPQVVKEGAKGIETVKPPIDFVLKDDNDFVDDDGSLEKIRIETLFKVCREVLGIVARDPDILPLEREEILIVCEAFEKALEFGGKSSVRIMYIALKNTINCSSISRKIAMQSDDLNRLMMEYFG